MLFFFIEFIKKSKGKISDQNWLENYLRPAFKNAMLHLIRMSKHAFWKHSSVYELFGVDFLLDENLKLWLLDANGSPQLIGTNSAKENLMIEMLNDLLEIQYTYLRSKTKRLFAVIHKMLGVSSLGQTVEIGNIQDEFSRANKNFLEPEFAIGKNNTWQKLLDENISGKAAYMGLLEDECITDRE